MLQSYQPLPIDHRGPAVNHFAKINNIEFVKLLLANGPIFGIYRDLALAQANEKNNPELIQLLRKPSIAWKIVAALGQDVAALVGYIWEVVAKLPLRMFKK